MSLSGSRCLPYRCRGDRGRARRDRRGAPAGDRRGEPGGQPALVGHRRRRLPGTSTARSWATSTSSGARRGCARPTPGCSATCAASGCWSWAAAPRPAPAGCAGQGAEVVALDLSAGMLRHAREAADRSGVRVPLVQADALALPFADESFDMVCTAFGAVPFVADSGRGDARGGPGAAARRPLGLLDHPPDALDLPATSRTRPGWSRATPTSTAARTSSRTTTACPPTSSSTAPSATGSASWWRPGSCCATSSSRSGPTGHEQIWGQWSPLRGRLFPGTAIFVSSRS